MSPPACPRGTMLIFVTGSYSGISAPTSACPDCATTMGLSASKDFTSKQITNQQPNNISNAPDSHAVQRCSCL